MGDYFNTPNLKLEEIHKQCDGDLGDMWEKEINALVQDAANRGPVESNAKGVGKKRTLKLTVELTPVAKGQQLDVAFKLESKAPSYEYEIQRMVPTETHDSYGNRILTARPINTGVTPDFFEQHEPVARVIAKNQPEPETIDQDQSEAN